MRKVWTCSGARSGDVAGGLFGELAGADNGKRIEERMVGKADEAESGEVAEYEGEGHRGVGLS